jgi:hypothetical protein
MAAVWFDRVAHGGAIGRTRGRRRERPWIVPKINLAGTAPRTAQQSP